MAMRRAVWLFCVVAVCLVAVGAGDAVAQAKDLKDVANNSKGVAQAFASAGFVILSLVGFLIAGVGIYKMIMAKKTNEPMGLGIAMAVGGALIGVLPLIIDATTTSAVGTKSKGLSELNLSGGG
jgi:hypothetical protein